MKDIKSTRALLKALQDLKVSLRLPYGSNSSNPEKDFLHSVSTVAFLSRIVFKDLLARQDIEISASWALSAAIALGDLEEASRFLSIEISEMKNDGVDLEQLKETTALALQNHGRSERWTQLLSQIDEEM